MENVVKVCMRFWWVGSEYFFISEKVEKFPKSEFDDLTTIEIP